MFLLSMLGKGKWLRNRCTHACLSICLCTYMHDERELPYSNIGASIVVSIFTFLHTFVYREAKIGILEIHITHFDYTQYTAKFAATNIIKVV